MHFMHSKWPNAYFLDVANKCVRNLSLISDGYEESGGKGRGRVGPSIQFYSPVDFINTACRWLCYVMLCFLNIGKIHNII